MITTQSPNLSCSVCLVLLTSPVHSAQGEGDRDSIRYHAGTVAALLENRAQRFKLQSRWMLQKSLVKFPPRSQKMTVWNADSDCSLMCPLTLWIWADEWSATIPEWQSSCAPKYLKYYFGFQGNSSVWRRTVTAEISASGARISSRS